MGREHGRAPALLHGAPRRARARPGRRPHLGPARRRARGRSAADARRRDGRPARPRRRGARHRDARSATRSCCFSATRGAPDGLRADLSLVPAAVEEILRLESPAQGLFRVTTREVSLGGVTLPEGARLMVHYGSANRDEDVFAARRTTTRGARASTGTSRSARASTSASAPRSRGSSSASRSRCCSSGPGLRLAGGRSGGSRSSSRGAWSGSTWSGIPRDGAGTLRHDRRSHHGETTLADRSRGGHDARRGAGRGHRRNRRAQATTISVDYATSFELRTRRVRLRRDGEGYFEQAGFDVQVTLRDRLGRQHQARRRAARLHARGHRRADGDAGERGACRAHRRGRPPEHDVGGVHAPGVERRNARRRSRARRSPTRPPRPCASSSRSTRRRPASTRRR